MDNSHGNTIRNVHVPEPPQTAITTDNLVDFCQERALRKPIKAVQRVTGLSRRQVENIRQGVSGVSGVTLTRWCINDPEFAAEYAEFIGLLRPGEAEFAGAYTRFVNAVVRRRGDS